MPRKRVLSLLLLLAVLMLLASGCAPVVAEDGSVSAPTWIAPLATPLELLIEAVYTYILTPIGLASYGLAIILVTMLIRALLYPLTRKQMQSMKKMQSIQPQMKEIQEKYGKDREKLAQKQMELYKQEGVNPAGGCLPLLIQMPILFAFYYALLLLGPKLNQPFLVDTQPGLPRVRARNGVVATAYTGASSVTSRAALPHTAHHLHRHAVHHAAHEPGH